MESRREPNIVKCDLASENMARDLKTEEVTEENPTDAHGSQAANAQTIPPDEAQYATYSVPVQTAAIHSEQAQVNTFKAVVQRIIKRFEDFVNGLMEKFVSKAPSGLTQFIARLLFYPTLYWNRMVKAENSSRRWYDRVTDRIVLGALPERKYIPILAEQEHVDVLLNLVREWKGLAKEYARYNMTQVWVPMTDFVPPSLDDIKLCVQHLEDLVLTQNKTVYVHCKAGRGRSATVVMAYLMKHHNMTPLEAQTFLESKRPHVLHLLHERQVIKDFYKELCQARSQASGDHEAVAQSPDDN